jgi:hypothetical protein
MVSFAHAAFGSPMMIGFEEWPSRLLKNYS